MGRFRVINDKPMKEFGSILSMYLVLAFISSCWTALLKRGNSFVPDEEIPSWLMIIDSAAGTNHARALRLANPSYERKATPSFHPDRVAGVLKLNTVTRIRN